MKEYTFLIVIGTDELPPKILKRLGKDFLNHILNELKNNFISYKSSHWYAAPRHLAIKLKILYNHKKLCDFKNDQSVCNAGVIDQHLSDQKKIEKSFSYLVKNSTSQNNKYSKKYIFDIDISSDDNFKGLLIQIIKNALEKLMNYAMMRWGRVVVPFIRPVNTFTILLDNYLVEGCFFEICVDRIIYGNRCIENNMIILDHADDYPNVLIEKGYIIPDYNVRKKTIKMAVEKQASELGGVVDMSNNNLLEEITALIEWPVVLYGRFSKRFLKLPVEVIVHIMKEHQKYFPVYDIVNGGMLLPYFIFVINTITDNYKKIIYGHESVIRARFIDVEFFLESDNQFRLEDCVPKLDSILFHRKLGSLKDKVDRITELSGWIASQINANIEQAKRASYLCKCDLVTNMVLEFPKLQGIIGMYYAYRDGESGKVALAQKEHYQPQFNSDILPSDLISCIVSISDKMDTITGMIGIKYFPTGSKDPFGLKRIATGLLRIIVQKKFFINLVDFIHKSVELYGSIFTNDFVIIKNDIYKFIYNRLCLYFCLQGYKLNVVQSILNTKGENFYIIDCIDRIRMVNKFCDSQNLEYINLCLVYKRIFNILQRQNICFKEGMILVGLFKCLEEVRLYDQIVLLEKRLQSLFEQNYSDDVIMVMIKLSYLANIFLDKVHVMHSDLNIKDNRLNLLNKTLGLILKVVDISVLCN